MITKQNENGVKMKIEFLVQGSAVEPYKVTFQKTGQHLSVFCTCPAGIYGKYCKHRISILNGSMEGIVSDNVQEVKTIVDLLVGTDVKDALEEFKLAEIEIERAKKNLEASKKNIATIMSS